METRVGKLLALSALGFSVLLLSSCASTTANTGNKSEDPQVSTIPWDRPEKWESGGGLPGMSSNPGGGY